MCVATAALVIVNQLIDAEYHWLDDTVFFLLVVGGPALVGALLADRARQVRRLEALQAELDEQQRVDVAAARLDEQSRVQQEVHARMAERVAGIVLRAEGARRAHDATALPVLEQEARGVLDQLRETLGSLSEPTPALDVRRAARAVADRSPSQLDVLLALGLGVAIAVESVVVSATRGPWWANVLASLAVATPLVWRRSHTDPRRGRVARCRHPDERLAHAPGHHGDAGGAADRHASTPSAPGAAAARGCSAGPSPLPATPASTSPPARPTTSTRAPG